MVQYNKNIKNNKKGFTLVELMVVLAITAILAVLVGGGLIAYTRLARFEKNEANARTLFQTAQISLTRMETAGELDAFRQQVMEEGSTGDHFQNDVTVTDAGGNTLVSRTKSELDQNVAALYYDRTGAAAGNHNALVKELLGDYIYDASLLNASICVEIDVQSGQVYSVFYDTKSDKLRFNQDGATNIYDRSYGHRRNDTLVGYYSAEDRVNVVQLVQTKLKVKNPRLTNGETLTLSWSGNSSLGDLDTSYTATAYDAKDTGKTKPLFTITIKRDTAGAADDNKQVITEMPVVIYQYDAAGQQTGTEEKKLYFPLSYNKGSFVLTLDAMADAALLRACENDAKVAATSLYSITRLLNDPKDIYIAMRAEPRENYSDTYTASKEETTNEENTLLAKGGTAVTADLKYFRHLYNLRWSADWDITNKGAYTLTPQASNSTGLNWTGGGVTVYCAAGAWPPVAKVPSLNDPVAWPTIPELGEKIELTSKTAGVITQTTRVPILNLQLSSKSVAKTGRAGQTELTDHYVGLIGENKGKISYITLRDPDIQVNVKTETVAAGALPNENQLKLTATKFVTALEEDDENWRDVRAVGALCGVNTGTLENCALTRGTNSSTSALVAAALAFDNTTTATDRKAQTLDAGGNRYTYYTDEPRGIGGLVGVAIPKADSVMQNLTVASDVTVAGLLVDKGTQSVTKTTAADQQAEKARYAAAAAEPDGENSLWRSVGVGGVFGTVDAAQIKTDSKTNIVNNGFVTGNGFTGGIVGNLFTKDTGTGAPSLTGLRNNGTVSAGANYKGDTAGDARSLVLGQFFGGIAGYDRGVTLQGCESVTRSDLTETQLKEQVKAGFDTTGTLTDASPLKGDFVGGLIGYGKDITLDNCKTGKGYVLGSRFVGGLAGGFTGSGVQKNDTNSSDVFGSRYVGGIVSVNGSNSIISGMTNTGLVAAFGQNAAYVGGIVGVNDANWGGSQDPKATATVQNCANRMSGDNATDTRRINLLKELSNPAGSSAGGCADYIGGIAGCNGKKGVVTWDTSTPTLGAILYGNNYVGGVAGYNDENAKISNTSGQNLTISGQIVAASKAVGGMIGLNCAPELPSATVKVSRVAGQQLVGGVIGANLPVGGFNVTGGAFNTDVASGRVEADAVAGGIIGYNRLLADKPAGVTLAALLPTIDESTGVLTDSTDAETETNTTITLTGFQNKLNLQADIYVGGIVGANDADTKLTIQNATNGAKQNALSVGGLNPSNGAFKDGVLLSELADGRYDFDDVHGALAGGIIGYATPNTKLENCTNYGTVAHKCAAGGFAGWNEGTIIGGSMEASLGNRETGYTYLGGVAGVNGGLIQSAYPAQGCAVRGDSYVGGIAGVNLGGDAEASKGLICTENNSTGTVEANQYAGGVAGANVGNISLSGQLQSSVTATGYAGGVAGINTDKGRIYGDENANGAVSGSVTAANYAGGVAGTNSAEITRVENHASVRASTQYAGGIAGVNDAGGKISACVHAQNQVYATNGEAGGIAGNNNKDALIENVQVRADVTAANGTAGGVTATNFGIIGQDSELENNSSVSNCTITGTSESIGAIAAYNRAGATIRNVKLAANANVQFSTPAVTIGGLAGMNEGTVTGCQVENGALALDAGLRAGTNTVTLGGAVGRTTADGTVSSTNVLLDLTQNLDKYTNLGGVAGQNDGTLKKCTYSGTMGGNADTDGLVPGGARSTGSTVGGIAGLNNNTITGCEVKYIKLQVSGISNITTTQTADEKLASASHVGGIAGRNNDEIVNSYVATERSNRAGSIITARYGFVGGVAGSNNGTITGSGSKKALVSDKEATLALVTQVDNWLDAADANAGINSMAAELTTGKTYANLMGVDTVSKEGCGYRNVYNQSGLAANDLLVALRGSNNSETVRADGYLGGLAGFNSLRGTIGTSATGQWFVYSDNATTASTVGGIIGQNESNVTDKSVLDTVVNCAAVRRFTRVFDGAKNKDDTDDDNIYKSENRVVVHVGGVIGQQQNRSDDRWSVSKVVNCGSVFNSRSANVGGVIAYWLDYGGTVQRCFNFGKITTNTNDKNSGYGAVGGIVGFIDQPISGGTTNVLSCRNYGQIWYKSNGANDCAGIIGKIEMKKVTDIMTLNIIDCVNSGAIKAASQAVGILAWIGPYDKGNIDYVTVNIDRCRNLNTDFTCSRKIGIVGSRGNGSGSNKATNVTNCFATVGTDWFPIAYLRLSGENVTGHGNYYIENSYDAGKSFFKNDSRKLTTEKPNSTTGNWEKADKQGSDKAYNETDWNSSSKKVKAHRLYIGYNVDDKTYPYIAFLPTLADDGNGAAYSLWWISGRTSAGSPAKPNSAYIKTDGKKAYIFDDTGAGNDTNPGNQRATVMLQFGEAANSTKSDVDITDITDEVIQNYYKYVLDSTKPAKPGEINVKASQVQDADNNVYGRYEVTWKEPTDTDASPASYYRVEILPCDAAGNITGVAYLTADVYQRSYTFVADKAWTDNFVVRVTPYNTNDDPKQPDKPNTSGVQTFMHALPTPEIEFRLVKRTGGGFDWGQCQTPDEKSREFKYEVVAVLKNYTEYPTDEAWTVKLTDGKHPYYFSRRNGKQYIRLTQNLERTLTLTALATPDNSSSTKYLRSAQYKSETYLPSQWRDNPGSAKDEDGLPLGTLNKDGSTDYVTYTGQTAESFEATVKFSFTPGVKSDSSEHGSPTYRVMLLAKYLGNDTVNGQSLNGQYITLAARESIVTGSPVTFNLNSLPSDAMTNYTDFLVVAVPVTSGKGDMKYRWDATPDEVSAAIASHASETNDTDKEIWWKNGYEIVRTGEHSYTYAHLTPLCFSDVNRTDDQGWAIQATQTTPQIIFKQLNLNVLKAPTLAEIIEDGVVDDKNQLTYTFNWTQEDMDAKTPTYSIKLYGLLTDKDGNVTGQEQIALKEGVNLADKVQNSGNSFTLPVNVDTMLANGSDSWRYDKVRLEVTRVAAAGTDEIGASAVADYSVKQRLPGISAPSSITRVNGETDNADALLYTVSWSLSADARIDHYDLCVVDDGGNTVLTLPTTDNVGSLTLDLEQYQGKALRFRVIAHCKDDSCFDGPDGALSQPETIVSRAAAPVVDNVAFDNNSPNQETFLNDLKLNMTLNAPAKGNVYFTGYIFSNENNYNTIAGLARTWQEKSTGQDKYKAQQELTKKLDEMLNNGDAELVIPEDSRTVGGSASVNDTTASYTFVPDGNGFTLTPDHAKQYLLPAVRVMPTDGTTASNWFYFLQDAAKAQLPAITLDAPVDEPERALGNAVYPQEVNLYNDPECKTSRGTDLLELRRFTVEWTAVNKYTQTDGTVRNLTDRYSFTVTPLGKDKMPYSITVTTYDRDETDKDGNVTHKRGEIKTVTKTYDGKTTEIAKQTTVVDAETNETRIWYDLSVEPVTDENGNVTWEPKPYDVTGTVEKDGGTLYYKAQTVPMLELVQEDGAEPVYRITLPELQEKVQDDSLELQKFTASVMLQTLTHSDNNGKTVESGTVKVPVNETNTADAAEDAQSMDSAESVAPAETAESTAAESAPASVPPVLMRARAALPMATPETAAAPDETDAAETAPPKRTETSDAS
ncbi:prepilin-type N-terminal cleavage/methylation domain-containing protein [Gemmiger formicilis]|uniref:prepilin-type N-terminal cleavage/methylation domain-containing protein n=3 Tax=Gemmiger formicilis TaxID=745368 RepID=UPI0039956535